MRKMNSAIGAQMDCFLAAGIEPEVRFSLDAGLFGVSRVL